MFNNSKVFVFVKECLYNKFMNPLEKAIVSTLSYFDIFNYPLTLMELWKWLYVEDNSLKEISIDDVLKRLDNSSVMKERIGSKNSFYFLKGRQDIVDVRAKRYGLAERKFHKALRVIKILRFMPFVKMIAVCNTLAYNNSRRQGDIDLFVVTKRRRVWQTRFWIAGFLTLFRLRPKPGKTQDTICPTFFVDEDSLDFEKLALENDIYFSYWVKQLVPVYDEGVYNKFINANLWAKKKLPNCLPISPTSRRFLERVGWLKKIFNAVGYFLPESLFKKYQLKVMPEGLKQMANKDSRVVVKDYMLKFHDNDRRLLFLKRWQIRKDQVL